MSEIRTDNENSQSATHPVEDHPSDEPIRPVSPISAPVTRSQTFAAISNGSTQLESQDTSPNASSHRLMGLSYLQDYQEEGWINVGPEYQADLPDCDPAHWSKVDSATDLDQSICLWRQPSADKQLSDDEIRGFCVTAQSQHNYTVEQALGLLLYNNYNMEKALSDLNEYQNVPDEWTTSEKILFEQAFSFNGKNFRRIKYMLPDKGISDLVEYYYTWKRKRHRQTSYAESAYRKRKTAWYQGSGRYNVSVDEADDDANEINSRVKLEPCSNCRKPAAQTIISPMGRLCAPCFLYWRKHGSVPGNSVLSQGASKTKPSSGPRRILNPPEDMALNVVEFVDALTVPGMQSPTVDAVATKRQGSLIKLEQQIMQLRAKAQENKSFVSRIGGTMGNRPQGQSGIYDISYLKSDFGQRKHSVTYKWSAYETLLALQGFRRYGKDFSAIAEVVGSKTEGHVKAFYQRDKERYKLDGLIDEYEKDKAASLTKITSVSAEVIDLGD